MSPALTGRLFTTSANGAMQKGKLEDHLGQISNLFNFCYLEVAYSRMLQSFNPLLTIV